MAGLILPAILYAVLAFLMISASFTFVPQTFQEIERKETIAFYFVLLLLILAVIIIVKQYKLGRKSLSFGVSFSSLLLVYALFRLGSIYFPDIVFEKPFNKEEWNKSKLKPFAMAKTVFKQNKLVGLHRKEIIQKLGYDEETAWNEGNTLLYSVENGWVLLIDLKKDTAVRMEFRERGFDL
jgi:hypothetical protein